MSTYLDDNGASFIGVTGTEAGTTWAQYAMIASAIGYWAVDFELTARGLSVHVDDEDGDRILTADWMTITEAIGLLATGYAVNYDGSRVRIGNYHATACRDLLFDPSDADWDVETDDLIVQQAVLGRQIFG